MRGISRTDSWAVPTFPIWGDEKKLVKEAGKYYRGGI